jgi:hypothetical protein
MICKRFRIYLESRFNDYSQPPQSGWLASLPLLRVIVVIVVILWKSNQDNLVAPNSDQTRKIRQACRNRDCADELPKQSQSARAFSRGGTHNQTDKQTDRQTDREITSSMTVLTF